MRVLINGNELTSSDSIMDDVVVDYTQEKNIIKRISVVINKVGNYAKKTYVSSSGLKMFAGVIGVNDASFYNILTKLQDFSFYIAVGWATWGIIEYILDKPEGVEKIKRAVWGYIGINAIPTLFGMVRDTFKMTNYVPSSVPNPNVTPPVVTPSQQSMLDIDFHEFLS